MDKDVQIVTRNVAGGSPCEAGGYVVGAPGLGIMADFLLESSETLMASGGFSGISELMYLENDQCPFCGVVGIVVRGREQSCQSYSDGNGRIRSVTFPPDYWLDWVCVECRFDLRSTRE